VDLRRGRRPDNEIDDTGDCEENGSDEEKKAGSGELFLLGGVARDFEEEEKEAGGHEEEEPDGDTCELGRDGAHVALRQLTNGKGKAQNSGWGR